MVVTGTGKNLPYYPPDVKISAIDFSQRMLSRAREKAMQNNQKVAFLEMDAQQLAFPDDYFDTVFATFDYKQKQDQLVAKLFTRCSRLYYEE